MKVKIEDEKIYVISDYNKEFIKRARYLQGKWESPYWVFPEESREKVKEFLKKVSALPMNYPIRITAAFRSAVLLCRFTTLI